MANIWESKSLKLNVSKTETVVCSKNDETLTIVDNKGYTLNQVETFEYLRSYVNAKGGCDKDVIELAEIEGTSRSVR